jgi:hypothetical protein
VSLPTFSLGPHAGLGKGVHIFKKASPRPPSTLFRPLQTTPLRTRNGDPGDVRVDRPRSADSHRGRDGRDPTNSRRRQMATIGTFTTNGNCFTGTIKTLNLNVKARIERVENPSD